MTSLTALTVNTNTLKIREALENTTQSEARADCFGALAQSKECLENLFDSQLWMGEDYEFDNDEDEKYYISLSHIESDLVLKGLIYNE
jgi:hypothetical protein